jgi:hypothetical protein
VARDSLLEGRWIRTLSVPREDDRGPTSNGPPGYVTPGAGRADPLLPSRAARYLPYGAEANPSRLARNPAGLAHFTKRSSVIGICFCEFRAKQDYLYRIVHPY